jgi:hypothetical protein
MADNIAITAGSGTTVSTEEVTTLNGGAVSAQHIQRFCVAQRTADGVASDVGFGGGTEATALRVTLATDSTGVVSVDDNSSTLSVDDGAGSLTVDAPVGTPVFVRLSDGASPISTLPVSVAGATAAGTNRIGSVRLVDSADADLTTTKGTQASRSVGTQDIKDSGRVHVNYYAISEAAGTTKTETAITLTRSEATSATTTGVSFVITSGKRYRITSITFATRGHNTGTAQQTQFRFRINTAGAVIVSSTPIVLSARSATPATANAWDRVLLPIPDGYEIVGDGTLQFGIDRKSVG